MSEYRLWLESPPPMSDQTACEMLDFLYEFINAFEEHYADQLRQPTPQSACPIDDLWPDFTDELP